MFSAHRARLQAPHGVDDQFCDVWYIYMRLSCFGRVCFPACIFILQHLDHYLFVGDIRLHCCILQQDLLEAVLHYILVDELEAMASDDDNDENSDSDDE